MTSEEQEGTDTLTLPPRRRRWRRGRKAALALLLLAGAGTLTVWIERRPIVTRFVDRELARRGVPASYRIEEVGLGRQRLTDLVIGDPRNPDLTADWVETRTGFGLGGPTLEGVRAGRVRMRGRLVEGRVSLGAIDRLLPPPSGKPFALPDIDLSVADGGLRLETPLGTIAIGLVGQGRLMDGFQGRAALLAQALGRDDCRATGITAAFRLRVADAAPSLAGPIRADRIACAGATLSRPAATLDVALGAALDRWTGEARLSAGRAAAAGVAAQRGSGTIRFAGTAARTAGQIDLDLGQASGAGWQAAQLGATGNWQVAQGASFDGRVRVRRASVRRDLASSARSLAGTPIGPVAIAIATAAERAAQRFDLDADLAAVTDATGASVHLAALDARAATGATIRATGGDGVRWSSTDGLRLASALSMAGGGLPDLRTSLSRDAAGDLRGEGAVDPYQAGGASLALAPFRFVIGRRTSSLRTVVTLSGPMGNGRVDGLRMPLDLAWDARGRWRLGPGCTPIAFDRLRLGGLDLAPGGTSLCPTGQALVSGQGGGVAGGARLPRLDLSGRLGGSPLSLAASGGTLALQDRGFVLNDVAVRLGAGDRANRLDAAIVRGRVAPDGLAGQVEGVSGKLAAVPLVVTEGVGDWTFRNNRFALQARTTVSDAQSPARFEPVVAPDLRLTLSDNRIEAAATLTHPPTGPRIALATIRHDLGSGIGSADLNVPGIAFAGEFQPEDLTRLTFGVIADVKGSIAGRGRIDWSPSGVTSSGRFGTRNMDLAAAFGPVTGISGDIVFTDLLALASAPDQVATVASINPGVPVTDGVVRYQTLPNARVAVRGARWPFAGGVLTLDPSLLDFSQPSERRLTFHVAGVQAAQFLQQFDFDNLNATGVFDGVLPMIFDESGGRIEGGSLTVREGGGTIAYVGELGRRQLGFWGDLAFQSLRSLRYQSLDIRMNGPLAGEMVTDVRFAGVSQGEGARSNFLIRRLQRLPLLFNVRITAPFRGLLDSAQSFYDPRRLIERNLPALIERQGRAPTPGPQPVQPPASEKEP